MESRRPFDCWKKLLVSYGALLSCFGIDKASSSANLLVPSPIIQDVECTPMPIPNTRRQLPENDPLSLEDEEKLNEFRPALMPFLSKSHPSCLKLPSSFQDPLKSTDLDPLSQWTPESLQEFDDRLQKQYGPKGKLQLLSTGTTIAGVCGYDNGRPFVVLGADTRATAGRMVADKRCSKVHCLASNVWCCGAGTSADLDHITRRCRYSLAMHFLVEKYSIGNGSRRWTTEKESTDLHVDTPVTHAASMASACRFFRDSLYEGGGGIGANIIAGGVDEGTGIPHIRAIHPHGSMDPLPYAALGSGGLAAMAVIESRFHRNITLDEGIRIVKEAIRSGIENDMGSGSQVDLCVITGENTKTGFRAYSSYARAVLPEKELTKVDQKQFTEILPEEEHRMGLSSKPGINGFGVPFSIRSKRVVLESHDARKETSSEEWDSLLGSS